MNSWVLTTTLCTLYDLAMRLNLKISLLNGNDFSTASLLQISLLCFEHVAWSEQRTKSFHEFNFESVAEFPMHFFGSVARLRWFKPPKFHYKKMFTFQISCVLLILSSVISVNSLGLTQIELRAKYGQGNFKQSLSEIRLRSSFQCSQKNKDCIFNFDWKILCIFEC